MIKKTIHYCWFGGNPLPELVKKCIESWKRFCPEYEIKEWNETNFNINCCQYVKEAYEAKKWAFVSDYCRFWVLYQQGGIYLDTDVELIKSLDDLPESFVGFEDQTICNSGLIRGAQKGDRICAEMLDSYQKDHFLLKDGTYNTQTVCVRETNILKAAGLIQDGKKQTVADTHIYPAEFFSPKSFLTGKLSITTNTYSIHHYNGSWYSEEEIFASQLREKYRKYMPAKIALRFSRFVAIVKKRGVRTAIKESIAFLSKKGG